MNEQIQIYKKKSNESLSLAQEYSLEHNLTPFSDINLINANSNNSTETNTSSLEIRKNIAATSRNKTNSVNIAR